MSEYTAALQSIDSRLRQLQRRLRCMSAARWGLRGLSIAAAGCALSFLWIKFTSTGQANTARLPWFLVSGLLIAGLIGLARRVSLLQAARKADAACNLHDRIATAIELRSLASSPLCERQAADACESLSKLNLRREFPFRLQRELWLAGTSMALLAGILVVPNLARMRNPSRAAEVAALAKSGELLERKLAANPATKAMDPRSEGAKARAEAAKLAKAMKKNEISKKAALAKLNKLTKELQKQQQAAAAKSAPATKSLHQAAAEMKKALAAQAAKAAEAKQKSASGKPNDKMAEAKPGQSPQSQQASPAQQKAMQAAQQALQQMQQAAAQANSAQMSAAMQQLAQQLQAGQLSQQQMAQLAQQLSKMAQALQNTQMNQAAQQLAQLAQQMQNMNLTPEQMAQLAQLAQQIAQQMKGQLQPGQGQGGQPGNMTAEQYAELLQMLKDAKGQLAFGNMPGQGMPSRSKGNGLGGPGKGGKGAGMTPSPFSPEDNKVKVAKLPPNTKVPGKRGGPNPTGATIVIKGDPTRGDAPAAPLYQVYADQKRVAEGAVQREPIPAEYRKQVKDYFDSIRP